MTPVPSTAVLGNWLPALWTGRIGGDDLFDLLARHGLPDQVAAPEGRMDVLEFSAALRASGVVRITAFATAAGVDLLPGPREVTQEAVAAGQALVFHRRIGEPATVLVPNPAVLRALPADPPRPHPLDVAGCRQELDAAILDAERALQQAPPSAVRPPAEPDLPELSPTTSGPARNLVVRAARIWQVAEAALAAGVDGPELRELRRAAARACLTGCCQDSTTADQTRRAPKAVR